MTLNEEKDDLLAALRIAQADRDRWKARAEKLADISGIKISDVDLIDINMGYRNYKRSKNEE